MSMFSHHRWPALAALGVMSLFPAAARSADPAAAPGTQPSQALLDRIDSLENEVKALKQQAKAQQQEAATQQAAADAGALRHEADHQSLLLDTEGFTSGYSDGRFLIQSADHRYVLHPWLQLQFRYETTNRDRAKFGGNSADTQSGFEVRRLKLGFDGNVISPDLTYLFQFAVDRKTGNFSLEQAYGKYHIPGTIFFLKGGQYKEPVDHEQLLASRYLTAIDRTFTDDLFLNSEGFVQGAGFGFDTGDGLRGEFAFTDGMRSANSNFQQFPSGANPANWGIAGRLDAKVFGKWKDYDRTLGAYNASQDFLVFGTGADLTEAGDTNVVTPVVDVDYGSKSGFSLYGAYTGRVYSHAAIGSFGSDGGTIGKVAQANGFDYSLRGQASYALDAHWEPYVQYEYIHLDGSDLPAGTTTRDFQVIRAGFNYYLYNTEARLSFDGNYLPEGSPVNDDGVGILATGPATKTAGFSRGGGKEFIFRAQFQLAL